MNFGVLPSAEFEIDPQGPLAGIEFGTVSQLFGEIKNRFNGPVLLVIAGERCPNGRREDTIRFNCERAAAGAMLRRLADDWGESEGGT